MPSDPTIQCPECGTEIKPTRAIQATVGMVGERQGIAGQSLQEIEGLELSHHEQAALPDHNDSIDK